jgi:competence protein ComEC
MAMNLIVAAMAMLTTGSGVLCSRLLGGGDRKEASRVAEQTLGFGLFFSLTITLLCQIFTGPIVSLLMPNADADSVLRQELENLEQIRLVRRKVSLPCGNGTIQIFPAPDGGEGNESSMCILFCTENCDILITGDRYVDGERQLLEEYSIPDIEVLVAGHHGADTSTGLELLHFTKPEVAVISVGKDNLYAHPHSATLKRLSNMGCLIRRTDQEGTIIIRG